jgi:hypothetical protein
MPPSLRTLTFVPTPCGPAYGPEVLCVTIFFTPPRTFPSGSAFGMKIEPLATIVPSTRAASYLYSIVEGVVGATFGILAVLVEWQDGTKHMRIPIATRRKWFIGRMNLSCEIRKNLKTNQSMRSPTVFASELSSIQIFLYDDGILWSVSVCRGMRLLRNSVAA